MVNTRTINMDSNVLYLGLIMVNVIVVTRVGSPEKSAFLSPEHLLFHRRHPFRMTPPAGPTGELPDAVPNCPPAPAPAADGDDGDDGDALDAE